MKTHVFIGTTCGPVAIQRITKEESSVQSVVCLNGTVEALPISAAYHDFVRRGTGIVARDFGHDAFRVDIAERVDQGVSWQLPMYVAHAVQANGRLGNGTPESGDTVIWATGEVGADGVIRPVERTADKLTQSLGQIQRWREAGMDVQVLLPDSNLAESVEQLSDLAGVAGVHTLQEAVGRFENCGRRRTSMTLIWHRFRPALLAAVLVLIGVFAVWLATSIFSGDTETIKLDDFGGEVEVPARDAQAESSARPARETGRTGKISETAVLRIGRLDASGDCNWSQRDRVSVGPGQGASLDRDGLCAIRVETPGGPAPMVVDLRAARLVPLGPERNGARRIRLEPAAHPQKLAFVWAAEAPLRTESLLRRFLEQAPSNTGLQERQIEEWAGDREQSLGIGWLEIR